MTVKDCMFDFCCMLAADWFNFGHFTLKTLAPTRYVHMCTAAIRALSLLLPPESGTANHHPSLLGHIEPCCTSHGHR